MSAVSPSCPEAPALVHFQLGLFREVAQIPASNRSYRHARRLAAEVIKRKVTLTFLALMPLSCRL